jgi:hypothetical protein
MVSKDTLNFAAKDLLKKIGKEKTSRSTAIKRPSLGKAIRLTRCSTSKMAM